LAADTTSVDGIRRTALRARNSTESCSVRIEYTFPGTKVPNIVIPKHKEGVPRKGESVLFIQDGEEHEYTVHHVIHIYDNRVNSNSIQIVLR